LGYKGQIADYPWDVKLNWYQIDFAGKALRITDPTMADKPGYDYKGRRYIPIGESTYSGTELALNLELPFNLRMGINYSGTANEWGEPEGSEGAQYLYFNADVEPGVDFQDSGSGEQSYDNNGVWDSGEPALHHNFTKKFGRRIETGMPQLNYGATLNWHWGGFAVDLAMRHYENIYVWDNNDAVVIGPGPDGLFGNADDEFSPTLQPATVWDAVLRYHHEVLRGMDFSVHINNVLNAHYWQTGNTYGVLPGPERSIILNWALTL